MSDSPEQIVITGAAMATGLGLTREQTWQAILQNRCAVREMTAVESSLPAGAEGGQAIDLPAEFESDLPREARYLKWVIDHALRDAKIDLASPGVDSSFAALFGTTLHGMRAGGEYLRTNNFSFLGNFLAGSTMRLALRGTRGAGLVATTCSACSSSLASIALGCTLLQTGQADLVLAGGYDPISEYVYGGFNSLRLIADGPLKPFSKNRRGMKVAEGYGVVVLERASDASRRGAGALAAILGWGESADAHHLTQPHPKGDGAVRAIHCAISSAGLSMHDIDLIAAHATATPDNDAGEFAAFSRVFGEHLPQIPVVAFKSHLGHTLGGAGAVELILSAMALRDQIVPACANITPDELEFPGLNVATGKPRPALLRHTLNTSLGFGGANACMVLGQPLSRSAALRLRPRREVFITGIGVVLPGIVGSEALLARLNSTSDPAGLNLRGSVTESELQGLLNARRVRRMSDYVKVTLAAATLACRDAGIDDIGAFAEESSAILGTMHGSVNFSRDYYSQLICEGVAAANPMLFAESVPNAGAAHLSLMLGIKGSCQSVIGTRTAGLDALALARSRILNGEWNRAFVGAGEEISELVNQAYQHCGLGSAEMCGPFAGETGFVAGAGAVIFILESTESVEQRGGRRLARIESTASHSGDRSEAIHTLASVLNELGGPANILSSACGTWIDRAESAAIARSANARRVSGIYGHIAETFSVSPLVALAAAIVSRKMPRLIGSGWKDGAVVGDAGLETIDSVAAICTDFGGSASGVQISMI